VHADDPVDQKQTRPRPAGRSTDATSVGRHRRAEPPRRPRRALLASTPARVALATGMSCCLGVAALAAVRQADDAPEPVRDALAERAAAAAEAEQRASRALDRSRASVSPSPAATPGATGSPTRPPRPRPVAGLSQLQMDNARTIVEVGRGMKLPRRALVVAVATAMQESDLHNLASDVLPESSRYPHQGSGSDHDSVGLFQQRPSSGWGSVRELMRPAYAARAFYEALRDVPGWQRMSVTAAAQSVQVSAYPGAYARHERRATTVVAALA
jgi:hypothetical protein